jgi:hypothetical protein
MRASNHSPWSILTQGARMLHKSGKLSPSLRRLQKIITYEQSNSYSTVKDYTTLELQWCTQAQQHYQCVHIEQLLTIL